MGLFNKLFKKKEAVNSMEEEKPEEIMSDEPLYSTEFINALSSCLGVARLRQLKFGEFISGRGWNVDFDNGIIKFGESEFSIAFIGSESYSSNTWKWGTDNINNFHDRIVEDVKAFHSSSFIQSLPELRAENLSIGELVNGHAIASLMAVAYGEPMCYYRCPYDGGAAYVVVKEPPSQVLSPSTATEMIKTITDMISQMNLNHKLLAKSILEANCLSVSDDDAQLIGALPNDSALTITFDSLGRIASMNTTLTA